MSSKRIWIDITSYEVRSMLQKNISHYQMNWCNEENFFLVWDQQVIMNYNVRFEEQMHRTSHCNQRISLTSHKISKWQEYKGAKIKKKNNNKSDYTNCYYNWNHINTNTRHRRIRNNSIKEFKWHEKVSAMVKGTNFDHVF